MEWKENGQPGFGSRPCRRLESGYEWKPKTVIPDRKRRATERAQPPPKLQKGGRLWPALVVGDGRGRWSWSAWKMDDRSNGTKWNDLWRDNKGIQHDIKHKEYK